MKQNSPQAMSSSRKRKLARTVIGASLMIVIGAGFSASTSASTPATAAHFDKSSLMTVVVAQGETLWSIAGLVGGDTSAVVDQILSLNHLTSTDVVAGEKLIVPTR
jgi:LysM repeat protein